LFDLSSLDADLQRVVGGLDRLPDAIRNSTVASKRYEVFAQRFFPAD
jgi:hypothetical protein